MSDGFTKDIFFGPKSIRTNELTIFFEDVLLFKQSKSHSNIWEAEAVTGRYVIVYEFSRYSVFINGPRYDEVDSFSEAIDRCVKRHSFLLERMSIKPPSHPPVLDDITDDYTISELTNILDKAENVVIAHGMGWDTEGTIECLREAIGDRLETRVLKR